LVGRKPLKKNKPMKEKIKKIINLKCLAILIGFLLFCWYIIMPPIIYFSYNKKAIKRSQERFKEEYSYRTGEIEKGVFIESDYEFYYKKCLRDWGQRR